MDDREIECSRCDATTIMIREEIPTGWMFIDADWDCINGQYFCPKCKRKYLRNQSIRNERNRMYPELKMYPCE